jgi:hypothetical protein
MTAGFPTITQPCGCQVAEQGGLVVLRCVKHELEELQERLGCVSCQWIDPTVGDLTRPACKGPGGRLPDILDGICYSRGRVS